MCTPDRVQKTFSEYLDLVEHRPQATTSTFPCSNAVRDFAEFGPRAAAAARGADQYTLNARNFWATTPPKVSVFDYDCRTRCSSRYLVERFTIIDPARLETAYPCVAYLQHLKRVAPGRFERRWAGREVDNFPLVNVTHPDLTRHPLFKDAFPFTVDLHPGDALLLPAYWYHQVDSYAEEGKLNVAVNYWFQGHSLATRLYRTLRENLFINCTEPVPPGHPHPCRG